MNTKEIQEAVKSLQRFLLDEYGWDTQKSANNSSTELATSSEIARKIEAEYLYSKSLKAGKTSF